VPGGRRFWLCLGLFGSAVTTFAMGLFQSLTAFLALRFLGGVASALVLVFTSALLLDFMARRRQAQLNALLYAGVGSGVAGSAVLVSALATAGASWSALWLASGVLSAAGATAAALMLPADIASQQGPPAKTRLAIGPRLRRLIIAYGLFGFGYIITATFLVALVRADPGLRVLEPVIWVVFGLAAVPSVALWNGFARRVTIPRAFALAALVEAAGIIASVVSQSYAGVLIASVCVGGTFMGLTALGLMRARELAQGDARQVLALMSSAFGLGQILGPIVAGFAFEHLQSFTLPSLTAALALIAAAALVAR
jgi:predicted MFS family arabinose efflux permease